ncbi:MAG TPA: DNA polymerase III subunit delta [Gemmatimonadaceae bacterium]|nr:DNA polymerase III subunit delta [Gemmatimonadaceae bacterium]
MAAANAHRDLRKGLQSRSFARAYYFYGDDEYLKDEMIRQMMDAVVDSATRDFNLDVRRGNEVDAETLLSLLSTPPMLAERRLVVVRDVQAMKKDARAALDQYLSAPAPDVVALLVAPVGVKADASLAEKTTAVEFEPLTGDRVPKWVVHHVMTTLKSTITPGAVDLLVSGVGNDLPQLAAELDKLASYANGVEIDEDAVAAIVGVRRGETLGDLLDRVLAHDAPGALAVIDHVLTQPKVTAVTVVMALTTQTLALAWARSARDRGFPAVGIERELFNLLKEGNAYPGRPWGEAVSAWGRALPRWTMPELEVALDALLAADFALKEARLSSDEQMLASLVLTLCGAPRRAAAA